MKDYSCLDGMKSNVQKELETAFNKGYEQGFEVGYCSTRSEMKNGKDDYNRGMEDAWEIARKIANDPSIGGMKSSEICKIFNVEFYREVFVYYTCDEVKEKIEEWEKKAEEDNPIPNGTIARTKIFGKNKVIITGHANENGYFIYRTLDLKGDVMWLGKNEFEVLDDKCDIQSCLDMLEEK